MSTISKKLTGMLYSGASLALASAPFKGSLNAVYGFNASGSGYTVFKPTSAFNSLQQLSPDGVYIVDAAQPGFELPGAMLTGASAPVSTAGSGAGPLSFTQCSLRAGVMLDVAVTSSDPDGQAVLLTTDAYPPGAFKLDVNVDMSIGLGPLPSGASYAVRAVNRLGNVLTQLVTVP